ncbi:MAG TPA: Imm50 family immunity protein [Opitutaceae bacterium]
MNHQAVVDRFGRWPAFHDANVLKYEPLVPEEPSIGLTLHTWNMTSEVDGKGFFVLRDHSLVGFRFHGVSNLDMDSFRSGNILFEVKFAPADSHSSFRVELKSVMDMSGSFTATAGEVVSVIPCTADGNPV